MEPERDALLVLSATVPRQAEKLFARAQHEASVRLRRQAEQRLGRRRVDCGVKWEEERSATERGVTITLRAFASEPAL